MKSVIEKDGAYFVYTVANNKAKKQVVTVEKGNGYYVLRTGLNENDKIIKAAEDVKDGMDVTVE